MTSALPLLAALALLGPVASEEDADAAAYTGQKQGLTYYDFDDDNIEGEVLSPDGANVDARVRARHGSLITIRPHFIPELYRISLDL